jgi:hypothetical protein
MTDAGYETNVFVNCPFDDVYQLIFDAVVIAVHDCGSKARCALEEQDSGSTEGLSRAAAIEKTYDSRIGSSFADLND